MLVFVLDMLGSNRGLSSMDYHHVAIGASGDNLYP